MNPLIQALVDVCARALARLPEVKSALAPYLHAKARLFLRIEIVTDGPEGPLPDPVINVEQDATVDVNGLRLDGLPKVEFNANGAR